MIDAQSGFHMVDVGQKAVTRRRALAKGSFIAARSTLRRVLAGDLPKGEVLKIAEVAGIMAAKRTPELLPLCHPLSIDSVRIRFCGRLDVEEPEIEVFCEVICHGKTGVEMEALTGVQVALLCIYDLTKGIDPALKISKIQLLEKEGGKSGHWFHPGIGQEAPDSPEVERLPEGTKVAVLTVSDRCARGESQDRTGPRIREAFLGMGAEVCAASIVPDEVPEIRGTLQEWVKTLRPEVIVLTGGTGISTRDVTPEAMQGLWDRVIPGFGELFRRKGQENTPMAWLSRAEAGLIGKTLVITLPGSLGAVSDGLHIFREVLPHTLRMLRDGGHP
jgi:molybdenum cofactor biosynthesis protein MoaC